MPELYFDNNIDDREERLTMYDKSELRDKFIAAAMISYEDPDRILIPQALAISEIGMIDTPPGPGYYSPHTEEGLVKIYPKFNFPDCCALFTLFSNPAPEMRNAVGYENIYDLVMDGSQGDLKQALKEIRRHEQFQSKNNHAQIRPLRRL